MPDAPRLTPLPPDALDDAQRAVYDAIVNGPRGAGRGAAGLSRPDGSLVGPFNAFLHAPALGDKIQATGAVARFGTELPRRLAELAILVVAREWAAQFEWWAHARLAKAEGVDEAVIEAIRVGDEPPFVEEAELCVYAFAKELLGPAHRVPAVLYQRAIDLFGERQVVELVGIIGYYCLVSGVLNAFAVELPEGVEAPFEEPVTP
jgi:4-carboxymuconolactone decarboxylase